MEKLFIRNHKTNEVAYLIWDVRHVHPAWVHEQLGTERESEIQDFLGCLDHREFSRNRGREDECGIFVEAETEAQRAIDTMQSEIRNGQYHLLGCVGNLPRRRWFDSYGDMVEALEKVN